MQQGGAPRLDRLRRKPDREAAAGAQASVVRGPVGHPVLLLRDVVAPSGISFERHEGCPCMVEGTRPGLTLPEAAQAGDRCNKAVLLVQGRLRPRPQSQLCALLAYARGCSCAKRQY